MGGILGESFRQMQTVQTVGKHGVIRRQQDQSMGLCPQCFTQRMTPFRVTRPHDHQAALGQAAGGGERIGQPVVIRHQGEQTRVEAGGGSC